MKQLLILCSFLFVACAGSAQELSEEKSVKPGVNDNFLAADLDVSQWVERFEREGREVYDQRMAVLKAIDLKPGQKIADIGAGTGLYTGLFSDAVGNEGTVYAVDIVPIFLSNILDRAKETQRTNIKTVLGSAKSTKLPANSVDKVFICDTYHHFEFPKNTLASISKALRPGGEIILIDFTREESESSDWIMNHVRAGEKVFCSEVEAAGFEKVAFYDVLKDNYMVRFRKK
ncbi:MAG: methyltransferase domain-containing protein [Verrucomicrobia bacterium]|jgi:ubiquinone/menaquinone biosynthesis C-methylase UbiE|nr:methyltransferase domain-containing protein [Verrucomicrobiota bacterium]